MNIVEKSLKFFPSDKYNKNKLIIIGDIHGCLKKMLELFKKLDINKTNGVYQHKDRFIIFLGDLIDRGNYMKETLEIIFEMIERKTATTIMGNHEFNFLSAFTKSPDGTPFRPMEKIPEKTLLTFSEYEKKFWSKKFFDLPILLDFGNIRFIHACWDQKYVEYFDRKSNDLKINYDHLVEMKTDENLKKAIRYSLKGKEIESPVIVHLFKEEYKNYRNLLRINWWDKIKEINWKTIAAKPHFFDDEKAKKYPVPKEAYQLLSAPYPENAPPIFFGHYNFTEIKILKPNVACIDFGAVYGNYLGSYIWDGEQNLKIDKIVYV